MTEPTLEIAQVARETMLVPIVGTAPLISHNFSEESKRAMLDAQQGKKAMKVQRDPQSEYLAAFYRIADEDGADRYGHPVTAFKAATTGAARFYGRDVPMTALRQFMFFRGLITKADAQQLIEIHGVPQMREDVVRLNGRTAYLRYRPEFPEWTATLQITYVTSSLSRQSILSLIDAGGMGVGVGDWRPENDGVFGTYMIDPDRDVAVIS